RRSVPPPFNNFPPLPHGPIPPPSMFIPGLNGMPMLNPFAFPGMNFPPGMMPPPMRRAPPPPPTNVNRSGVNLPSSVLLRRRNNEGNLDLYNYSNSIFNFQQMLLRILISSRDLRCGRR